MMMVDGDELKHLRALERVVLNQLDTTDPKAIAAWIVNARKFIDRVIESSAPLDVPSHVARCAPTPEPQPQADGEPTEQDVIGLLREHTARVEHPLRTCVETLDYLDHVMGYAESRGSC